MQYDSPVELPDAPPTAPPAATPAASGTPAGEGRTPRRAIYLLPNLLTTAAMFAGFYGIVASIDGRFDRAAIALYVAMLFDGLDGRVARWTKTESAFGKEFDSLSDMVSFGIAPALITYQWGVARIVEYGTAWGRIGWLAAFLYAVAAAFRLARFNTRTAVVEKGYFEGLPSPTAAAVVASFIWVAENFEIGGLPGLALGFGVTALAGGLMVSQFLYPNFKSAGGAKRRVRFAYLLLVPLAFVAIAVDPPITLLALSSVFALSAPAIWLWRKLLRRRSPREAAEG